MIKASIDIGSNSCLLLIGEFSNNEFIEKFSESNVTGLGRGLDQTGKFSDEAMEDTFQVLKRYSQILLDHQIKNDEVIITATEAARVASNSAEFITRVKNNLGLSITLISGEGEAYYSSLGASLNINSNCVLMDIGGASTEFIKISTNPFQVIDFISLPIGVVRLTDWKKEPGADEKLRTVFKNLNKNLFKTYEIVGIAGSVTSHCAMFLNLKEYKDSLVNKVSISQEQYSNFSENLINQSVEDLNKAFPYLGKRALVTHAGADIINYVFEYLEADTITVSTFGLRHGTLYAQGIEAKFKC